MPNTIGENKNAESLKERALTGDLKRFCMLPFVLLNCRTNGMLKHCGRVEGNVGFITKDDGQTPFNLHENSIDEIWNSKFLKEFRLKKIRNEFIPQCRVCYRDDENGHESKRLTYILKFYEKYKHIVEYAAKNSGSVNHLPVQWEIRMSNICNSRCVICWAGNSNQIYKEIKENINNPLLPPIQRDTYFYEQGKREKYKRLGPEFIQKLWDNIKTIEWLELHGGEPYADSGMVRLLAEISEKGFSKKIKIHTFSNVTLINQNHMDILNNYKGGNFKASIDAFGEELYYVRYPTKWNQVLRGLDLLKNLHEGWRVSVKITISLYNIYNIDNLLDYLSSNYTNFGIEFSCINSPKFMRPELLPEKLKRVVVKKLENFSNNARCIPVAKQLIALMETSEGELADRSRMSVPEYQRFCKGLLNEWRRHTRYFDSVRGLSVEKVFPHLKELYLEEGNELN